MHEIKFLDGSIKHFSTLKGGDLSGANLRGANLRGANLSGAYLKGADLRDSDLSCAYLRGAYLNGTDLRGANLRGADLSGANLYNTSIIIFQLGKHFAFYHEGYLRIGCQGHLLSYWINHVDRIGELNSYSPKEISKYIVFINSLKLLEEKELI